MSSMAARYFPGMFARLNGATNQCPVCVDGLALDSEATGACEVEISDETLILRLQQKDVAALGLLYRRYAKLFYSVCARILRNSAEAEDMVQEVFLCLYRRCRSYDPAKGCARPWIVQLTYTTCFNRLGSLKTQQAREVRNHENNSLEDVRSESNERWDFADSIISNPRMKAAVEKLSKEQRLTLNLYYFKGYTFQEIAEELGHTYGNVKNHFYRGIERLRRIVMTSSTGEP